ncbi:hypothetical protein ACA910_013164 [Epithemia clementina (nom. ined.)]
MSETFQGTSGGFDPFDFLTFESISRGHSTDRSAVSSFATSSEVQPEPCVGPNKNPLEDNPSPSCFSSNHSSVVQFKPAPSRFSASQPPLSPTSICFELEQASYDVCHSPSTKDLNPESPAVSPTLSISSSQANSKPMNKALSLSDETNSPVQDSTKQTEDPFSMVDKMSVVRDQPLYEEIHQKQQCYDHTNNGSKMGALSLPTLSQHMPSEPQLSDSSLEKTELSKQKNCLDLESQNNDDNACPSQEQASPEQQVKHTSVQGISMTSSLHVESAHKQCVGRYLQGGGTEEDWPCTFSHQHVPSLYDHGQSANNEMKNCTSFPSSSLQQMTSQSQTEGGTNGAFSDHVEYSKTHCFMDLNAQSNESIANHFSQQQMLQAAKEQTAPTLTADSSTLECREAMDTQSYCMDHHNQGNQTTSSPGVMSKSMTNISSLTIDNSLSSFADTTHEQPYYAEPGSERRNQLSPPTSPQQIPLQPLNQKPQEQRQSFHNVTGDGDTQLFQDTFHQQPYYTNRQNETKEDTVSLSAECLIPSSDEKAPHAQDFTINTAPWPFTAVIHSQPYQTNASTGTTIPPRLSMHQMLPQQQLQRPSPHYFTTDSPSPMLDKQPNYSNNDSVSRPAPQQQPSPTASAPSISARNLIMDRALSLFDETIHKEPYYMDSEDEKKDRVPSASPQNSNPKQENQSPTAQNVGMEASTMSLFEFFYKQSYVSNVQTRKKYDSVSQPASRSQVQATGPIPQNATMDRALALFGETIHKQPYYTDATYDTAEDAEPVPAPALQVPPTTPQVQGSTAQNVTMHRAFDLFEETIHNNVSPKQQEQGCMKELGDVGKDPSVPGQASHNKEPNNDGDGKDEESFSKPRSQLFKKPSKSKSESNQNEQPKLAETTRKMKPKISASEDDDEDPEPFAGMKSRLDLEREKAARAKALILLEAGLMH